MTDRNSAQRAMNCAAVDEAIGVVGSVAETASRLGISDTRLHNWRHRGAPIRWIPRLARVTGNRVPCHRFDPIAYPEVLGEPISEVP